MSQSSLKQLCGSVRGDSGSRLALVRASCVVGSVTQDLGQKRVLPCLEPASVSCVPPHLPIPVSYVGASGTALTASG